MGHFGPPILKKIWSPVSVHVQQVTPPNGMGESFQDYSWIQDYEADFP